MFKHKDNWAIKAIKSDFVSAIGIVVSVGTFIYGIASDSKIPVVTGSVAAGTIRYIAVSVVGLIALGAFIGLAVYNYKRRKR
jgi:hypothetical protein